MAAVSHPILRKLLSFGSGVGIVIGERDLEVALVSVRPGGIRIAGTLLIEAFRERPAAEWSAEYLKFLERHGQKHASAVAVLPRRQVTIRTITLNGVTDHDAPAAIGFQLDSLHPYDEADVYLDWQRLERTATFVVAVALREVVDGYAALFAEAGIALSGMTFSGGAIQRALRLLQLPSADGTLAINGGIGATPPFEIYGENPGGSLLSVEFDMALDRAASLARAELRLPSETETRDLIEVLPAWRDAGPTVDLSPEGKSKIAGPYAAALAAACPQLGSPVNVLPAEMRTGRSRAVYIPTAFLAVVLVGLGLALLFQRAWLERTYVKRLEQQIHQLEPVVKRAESLDRRSALMMERIQMLDQFRKASRQDLDLLLGLTRTIEPPGFVSSLTMTRANVMISGSVQQADSLLKRLEELPQLRNVDFAAPLTRNPSNDSEIFRVRGEREAGR